MAARALRDLRTPGLTAAKDTPLVEGFSGATPLELCERFATGLLDRDTLIDELTRWDYTTLTTHDDNETTSGTWADVTHARHHDLIDQTTYNEILTRRHSGTPTSQRRLTERNPREHPTP